MRYFKWKLSEGTWGTGPEVKLNLVNRIAVGGYVDADGYRIGYLKDYDISGADSEWDVTEVSEADALTFAQAIWADAEVDSDGMITSESPSDIDDVHVE
jgi:hypothetical protein